MLNATSKEETGGPKTTGLAPGSISHSDQTRPPAVRTLSDGSRNIAGLAGKSKSSPDVSPKTPGPSIIHQLGIAELLDQDDRPTFILDMSDQSNFEPGPIKVIFVNIALKSIPGILDRITGQNIHDSPALTSTTAFSEFKSWATSYVKDHQTMNVALPSYKFAGITWTCSTLKKRIRVFKAHANVVHFAKGSHPDLLEDEVSSFGRISPQIISAGLVQEEQQDYFGSASLPISTHSRMASIEKAERSSKKIFQQLPIRKRIRNTGRSASRSASTSPVGVRSEASTLDAADVGNEAYYPSHLQLNKGFFDWTRLPNSPSLPAHIRFALDVDWGSTPLGPLHTWSSDLRSMCNLIMASPHPAAMYWGSEHVAIYNEAYILLAGSKHPELMGQSYREAWAEIWDDIEPVFEDATQKGQSTMRDDDCLFISRSAEENLEETYFSWSIIPLVGSDGTIVGLYNPAFEKTRRNIAERRMLTLREMGDRTALARDSKSFWTEVLKALEYNERDAPFVLLYSITDPDSITDEDDSDSQSSECSSLSGYSRCLLEGTIGVPRGHPAARSTIDIIYGDDYFAQTFRKAMQNENPTYLSVEEGTLNPEYLKNIQWRGFGVPSTTAVCCPIQLKGKGQVVGFLFMGLNPRRPYDDDYSLYVQLLNRQINTAMASVVLFEEEIAQRQKAARLAAIEQIELSNLLRETVEQANENEFKFTRLSELNPSGMFIADSKGRITYCNAKMYHITHVDEDALEDDEWMEAIVDEDRARFQQLWADLVDKRLVLNTEIRFKARWTDRYGNDGDTWVLAMAEPQQDQAGNIKMILGSMTNISEQKWAEHFEKRRMEEAVKLRRQQENFIDITSHEMRNPLSAILQCAEGLTIFLRDLKANRYGKRPDHLNDEILEEQLDTSSTVSVCGEHQTRIVDDILTLSKLDSGLLVVTPCASQPASIVQKTLKIFETSAHSNKIELASHLDDSLDKFGIEWVNMDPSRVLQILINLTTNAIKFTATQPHQRSITITIGASKVPPTRFGHVDFVPTISSSKDLTENTQDWGSGEQVYIHYSVQDTGRGLTDQEKTQLFLRFSQASRHTHLTYGGSGLGLFICRQLAELQGGAIGVASTAGVGSTFAFYIKARRTIKPSEGYDSAKVKSNLLSSPQIFTDTSISSKARSANMANVHALVVDDNNVVQKYSAKALELRGCTVHFADNGHEAIEQLKRSNFWKGANASSSIHIDVVLMDQQMPVMNGVEATTRIRQYERSGDIVAHVPIICTTGHGGDEHKQEAEQAGMVSLVQ